MSTSPDQTSQLAQNLPGFDAAPAIANMEQGLLGSLGTPVQQTLSELPLQRFSPEEPAAALTDLQEPANLGGLANQIDPFHLITPVINGLRTLGTGQFGGMDPTSVFNGISNAFDGAASSLQPAMGSIAQDWQGASGEAARATTRAALANGNEVATQAHGVHNNLSTTASNVAQARKQMIEIIDEFQAKIAACDLNTRDGRAAAVAAANQATTESTALLQECQGNLGTQTQQVSAIGTPVGVTQAPAVGASMTGGPMSSIMGSSGLLPTGVLSDPRLTPNSLAENFLDLLFLPKTATDLDRGITQTNSTIGQTNTIMAGLGNTLNTTNSTLGRATTSIDNTNAALGRATTSIDNTNAALGTATTAINNTNTALQPLPGALSQATGAINNTNEALSPTSPINKNLHQTNEELQPLPGALSQATGAINNTNEALSPTSPINKNLHQTNEELNPLNDELHTINKLNPFTW